MPSESRGVSRGLALLGFAGATGLVAVLGARASPARRGQGRRRWYGQLEKPPFQPPVTAFGPVWSALYVLIAASGWQTYDAAAGRERDRALALWAAQLGLNGLWSWLFFARRRPSLALLDCALLFATVGAYAWEARKVRKSASLLVLPYLAWVGFATYLNSEIVRRNPERSEPIGPLQPARDPGGAPLGQAR